MSCEDLPENAPELPLTDHRLAGDVVDLIVSQPNRAGGCIGVMLCDERDRGITPFVVHDVPHDAGVRVMTGLLDQVLPVVASVGGAILMARGRPCGVHPSDDDREWHQTVIDACRERNVRLLGYYLATRDGVFRLPDPLEAVARNPAQRAAGMALRRWGRAPVLRRSPGGRRPSGA